MLRGSCLCSAISYHADGPVHHASHCYCTMCQKQHGAAAGSYANVDSAGFAFERGADMVTEYASSESACRGFCRVCGSTLYWRSLQQPDRIAVTLGTLDHDFGQPVERELYTDTRPGWLPTIGTANG
jgi:hypothetical protein